MQTSQVHCLGVCFDDFRKEHTVAQALKTLENMSSVMDKMFDGIISRVNEEADRIAQIDERIEDAKAKVKKITGITTSTTVHSAAKYPASEKLKGFKRLNHGATFSRMPEFSLADENAHFLPSDRKISRKRERSLIDLYSDVNPDLSQFETGLKRGLGQLPRHLPSVSSMLLFDSKSNPYKDYNVLPSLMGRDVKRRGDNGDEAGRSMGDAPDTFMNPDSAMNAQQLDFLHRPAAPEVAPIEFMNLADFDPSFKNIASNINYESLSGNALPSIAPTAHQKSGLPDLPAIMDAPGAQTSSIPPVSNQTAPPPPPVTTTTAPPPPPPPPTTTQKAPPPPPVTSSNKPSVAKVDKRPKEDQPPPMAGGLLGDIAKGMKLKSAKKRKLKKKKKKKGKPTLADQLRNRLNRRADFMSGRSRKKKKKKKKKISIKMKEPEKPKKSLLNLNAIPKKRDRSHTFEDDEEWSD